MIENTHFLLLAAGLFNGIQNIIRFWWNISFFKNVPKKSWFYQWANPKVSHKNKYFLTKYYGKNGFLDIFIFLGTKLLSYPLVFLTDLWHLMKFLTLNSLFLIIIYEGMHGFYESDAILYSLLILNLVWGFAFEGIVIISKLNFKK